MKTLYLLIIFVFFCSCISHSKLLGEKELPLLCKLSLECMAYNKDNPTACNSVNDLCTWAGRKNECIKDSLDENGINKNLSRREIFLDCMTRIK